MGIIDSMVSIFGKGMDITNNQKQNKLDRDWDKKKMYLQTAMDQGNYRFQNLEGLSLAKQGMIRAGINPAWNDNLGAQGSLSMPTGGAPASHTQSQGLNTNFLDGMLAISQANLLKAQTEKTKAEKDAVQTENIRNSEEDYFGSYTSLAANDHRYNEATGKLEIKIGEDAWIDANNLPTTKRGYEALRTYHEVKKDISAYQTEEQKMILDKMVAKLQIENKDVQMAMASIPYWEVRNLMLQGDAQSMENELTRISKDYWTQIDEKDKTGIIKFLSSAFLTFFNKK